MGFTREAARVNESQHSSVSRRSPEPLAVPDHPLFALQQSAGNQAVQALLRQAGIQAKLAISQPDDPEEREADQVADHIMRSHGTASNSAPCSCSAGGDMCEECKQKQGEAAPTSSAQSAPALDRKCATCEEEENKLARHTAGKPMAADATLAPPIVREVLGASGTPLDTATRAFFEPRFGRDFSKVRVHSDSRAANSAEAVNALAYTVGPQIVFAPGRYRPDSVGGKQLLAHELTHVVQRGSAAQSAPPLRRDRRGDSSGPNIESSAAASASGGSHHSIGANSGLVQRQAGGTIPASTSSGPGTGSTGAGGTSGTPEPETCPAPPDLECPATKAPVSGVSKTIQFLVDKSDLDKLALDEIHDAAKSWHAAGGTGIVRIDAYASAEYECVYNWRLSCRRAKAVAAELEHPGDGSAGVPATNISLFAHGESAEAGAALSPNRRATISLPVGPGPVPKPKPEPKPEPSDERRCGPDITPALSATLSAVESYFHGLSSWEKRRSCMAITGDFALAGVNPSMAWDVVQLFLPNTSWLDSYFRSGGCGSPRDPGCETDPYRGLCETKGTCGNSVLVGGKCMLAGTANYAVYGKMFRLCSDEFFYYWGFQMRNLIRIWKTIDWDDSGPPIAMANSTYDGTFPSASADAENRGDCTGRCASSRAGAFDFVWEPYKSRAGGGR